MPDDGAVVVDEGQEHGTFVCRWVRCGSGWGWVSAAWKWADKTMLSRSTEEFQSLNIIIPFFVLPHVSYYAHRRTTKRRST